MNNNNKHFLIIIAVLLIVLCTFIVSCRTNNSSESSATAQSLTHSSASAGNSSSVTTEKSVITSVTKTTANTPDFSITSTRSSTQHSTTSNEPDVSVTTSVTVTNSITTVTKAKTTSVTTIMTTPAVTTKITTTKKEPDPVTTTTTKRVTTTTAKPVVTTEPKPAGPAVGTSIKIKYIVNNSLAGSIQGSSSQTILYGKTSTTKVTAVAKLGYRFVKWSDGITSASREKEMPDANMTVEAIFEVYALDLPILMINTSTGSDVTSRDTYIDGTISVLNTEEKYLLDNLEMQIRGRGNYTWDSTFNSDPMYNKRPYRIKLSEQQKLAGVGEGKSKNWVLLADHCDQSLLRNNIVYTFAKSLTGIYWEPTVQSVEVYLNGNYHGVYLLCEQVSVNKNKVAISEDLTTAEVAFLVMYSGYTDLNDFYSFSMAGNKYEIKSDLSEGSSLAQQQKQYIVNYMNQCWSAVERGSQAQIEALIDLDSLIDSYIVHELFKNLDTGWDNFYMYKDINGKLCFGPVWDFDQCAGNADEGVDNPEGIRGGQTQAWYAQLLEHNWFRKLLQNRWNDLADEVASIPGLIISTAESGYDSYCRNFDKWKIFGYKINRETYVRQFNTYKQHYEYFAEFIRQRTQWLDSYWGSPVFTFDGSLTLSGSGTVNNPYLISSAQDFLNFTLCLKNGQTFGGKFFLQTCNIDLTNTEHYNGIGADGTFAGCYNGNGYIINVNINGSDNCIFPYVTGTVMNVITDGTINNSGIAAGIARSVRTGGTIVNCASYIDIAANGNAGGIVGSNQPSAAIVNCFFGGSLNSPQMTGAINVWYSDRPGTFFGNIYLSSVYNNTFDVDNGQSEEAVESITADVADTLNQDIASSADVSSVSADDLCLWKIDSGKLVLENK